MLDRKVVDVIKSMPERNRFMKGLFSWAGFRQAARVAITARTARDRRDQVNYWKLWTLAVDGITSASTVPLRVWSYLGGVSRPVSRSVFAVFIVVRTLISGIAGARAMPR